jgi:hypothetical protein
MKHDARAPIKSSEESVLYISLSLFIILLAFFLVLNSHSDFEQGRVGAVLSSVEQTFTTKIFDDGAGPSFVADLSQGRGNGFATEDMANLFRSSMAGVEPYLMPSKEFLSVELSPTEFKNMTLSLGENEVPSTVAAMVSRALEGSDKSVPNLQIEIWVKQNDSEQKNHLKTADQFVQNLIARGVAPARASIGTSSAVSTGKILLLFRPYSPYGVGG